MTDVAHPVHALRRVAHRGHPDLVQDRRDRRDADHQTPRDVDHQSPRDADRPDHRDHVLDRPDPDPDRDHPDAARTRQDADHPDPNPDPDPDHPDAAHTRRDADHPDPNPDPDPDHPDAAAERHRGDGRRGVAESDDHSATSRVGAYLGAAESDDHSGLLVEQVAPNAAKPLAAQPNAAKPLAAQPNAAKQLAAQPNAAQPLAVSPHRLPPPNAAMPLTAQPKAVRPLAASPHRQPSALPAVTAQPGRSARSQRVPAWRPQADAPTKCAWRHLWVRRFGQRAIRRPWREHRPARSSSRRRRPLSAPPFWLPPFWSRACPRRPRCRSSSPAPSCGRPLPPRPAAGPERGRLAPPASGDGRLAPQ